MPKDPKKGDEGEGPEVGCPPASPPRTQILFFMGAKVLAVQRLQLSVQVNSLCEIGEFA